MRPAPRLRRTLPLAALAFGCNKPLGTGTGEQGGSAATAVTDHAANVEPRPPSEQSTALNAGVPCAPVEAPVAPLGARASCAHIGPKACPAPPRDEAGLCNESTPCVTSRAEGLQDSKIECAPERSPSPGAGPFVNRTAAPGNSGALSTALVHLRAVDEYGPQLGATYLAVELTEGWCLVDEVLTWERESSYFRTELQTRWEGDGAGRRLIVEARDVRRDMISAEEAAAGVSEIVGDRRLLIHYDVDGGVFARAYHESHHTDLTFAPPGSFEP